MPVLGFLLNKFADLKVSNFIKEIPTQVLLRTSILNKIHLEERQRANASEPFQELSVKKLFSEFWKFHRINVYTRDRFNPFSKNPAKWSNILKKFTKFI